MAAKKNGSGIREVAPGKLRVTMYDPRAKGKTRHIGTFTFPPQPDTGQNWYPTKAKAVKAAEQAKQAEEDLRDKRLKAPQGQIETIASFAERWPRDYTERRGPTTLAHNAERVRALVRDFGDRPLNGISVVEARTWIKGGIAPQDIRDVARKWHKAKLLEDGDVLVPEHTGHHLVVRAMLNDAIKTWPQLGPNPFASLNVPEKQGRRGQAITVLTPGELDLLIETAHETLGEFGHHYSALIEAAAWTGMRPGELWAVNIEETQTHNYVDHDAGEVRVLWQYNNKAKRTRPKWDSRRTIFLLPPAGSAFKRAAGERTIGEMFVSIRGLRMRNYINQSYWEQVRAAFWQRLPEDRRSPIQARDGGPEPGKIPLDLDFYELRHFFGTQLAEMRLTPPEIADQMGHKDGGELAMRRYIHPRKEAVRRSMLDRYAEYERRQRKAASGE